MNLEGIHHITMITGDAPGNVDFYTRVLGLRMVARTTRPCTTSSAPTSRARPGRR
jgi:catechol 2,3-dioxygenase-like lactoylglutathione lyase family enzyme